MNIYLARHGETNFNKLNLCNDDPRVDVHLTKRGKNQAKELGKSIVNIDFDVGIISELPRTKETLLTAMPNLKYIIDKRINEIITGYDSKDVKAYYDIVARDKLDGKHPKGESHREMFHRVILFFEDLKTKDYKNVLIISHGSLVQAMQCYLDNSGIKGLIHKPMPDNCTLFRCCLFV